VACAEPQQCSLTLTVRDRQLAATNVVFLIDRSGSMQDSGELVLAKREVVLALSESEGIETFAIVFFDRSQLVFPRNESDEPAVVDHETVLAGIDFINRVPGGRETCLRQAFERAIRFAENVPEGRTAIVYVGDGGGTCPSDRTEEWEHLQRAFREITSLNDQRFQIMPFGVRIVGRHFQTKILHDLATGNGGVYTHIRD